LHETSKATARRRTTNPTFWHKVFQGYVLDVGPGDDPLLKTDWPKIIDVQLLDKEQGDANEIGALFGNKPSFDCIHASQLMEHVYHPLAVLQQMLVLLKSGGHVVFTVPDYDLYEHATFPSKNNFDHKSTWSLWRKEVPGTHTHIYVPGLPYQLPNCGYKAALCDGNYDYMRHRSGEDQTMRSDLPVEAFIEVVIVKLH